MDICQIRGDFFFYSKTIFNISVSILGKNLSFLLRKPNRLKLSYQIWYSENLTLLYNLKFQKSREKYKRIICLTKRIYTFIETLIRGIVFHAKDLE